jgi:phosphoglycerol transferase MdoB-like AlkP superfamily enzyme
MNWMKPELPYYVTAFKRLLVVLLFYQTIRLAFFIINHSYFKSVQLGDYFHLVYQSLRFDLSLVLTVNSLFLVLTLLLIPYKGNLILRNITHWIFILTNVLCFGFDIADIAYYPYVRKRMNSDVFDLIFKKSDFIDLLPCYLQQFWFVPLLIVLFIVLFSWVSVRFASLKSHEKIKLKLSALGIDLLFFALVFVGIRGGFQLKPLQSIDALAVTESSEVPLVVNTPFSILHSFELKRMVPIHFMSEFEVYSYYQPIKSYRKNKIPTKDNIVLIVLESFGKGYTGAGGRESFTPFLDSLMRNGLNFSNAYANAFRSADGIPACVAGIPHFMDDALSYSPYASNEIDALPLLLKKIGYTSAFYHGGTNGTMNFDAFAKHAGFDDYIGRKEYAQDADYDGTWGIWDEPFLQFVGKHQSQLKQPFFSTIFTLSSHEPFGLPSNFNQDKIKKLKGIQRGIAYGDYALQQYFHTVSSQPWFENTLFIITADHNFLACRDSLNFYNEKLGLFAVPMIFYQPNQARNIKGNRSNLVQQVDILPTVMDYVSHPDSFFAYGKSMFDTTLAATSFHLFDNYYYFRHQNRVVTAFGETIQATYDFNLDSTLTRPLPSNDSLGLVAIKYYKAYRQLLFNTIPENKMSYKTFRLNGMAQ